MSKFKTKMMLSIGLSVFALSPSVWADQWNQKTIFKFNGPVEIPGRTLDAGTYVFKLANSQAHRNIVQVFSEDEKQVLSTFMAIPDYRMHPSDKTIITFTERPGDSPDAVKGWFYPGRNFGHEFVYPKNKAMELARTRHTPVPAMPAELASETTQPEVTLESPAVARLESAPLIVEEPDGQEVEVAAVFPSTPSHSSAIPAELPSTASVTPLIGLIGLLSLSTAGALKLAAVRAK